MIETLKKINKQMLLAIIGGITLFSSWIVEKKYESEWVNKKQNLERSQLVIDITEVRRSNYEVAYNIEAQKKNQDITTITFIQVGLCRTYMDLLSWSKGRITDDSGKYNKIVQLKKEIDEENINSFKSGNYNQVHLNFDMVKATFEAEYLKLDNNFATKVDEVDSNQKFWNNIFTSLYFLGSILVGISFILEKTKLNDGASVLPTNKKNNKIANKKPRS
jgi:hypothetical protein